MRFKSLKLSLGDVFISFMW